MSGRMLARAVVRIVFDIYSRLWKHICPTCIDECSCKHRCYRVEIAARQLVKRGSGTEPESVARFRKRSPL